MKKIKILLFTILAICMIYFVFAKVAEFIAIDKCLDKGCVWNYSAKECQCLNEPTNNKK